MDGRFFHARFAFLVADYQSGIAGRWRDCRGPDSRAKISTTTTQYHNQHPQSLSLEVTARIQG
jgi:hypothetical protein